VGSFRKNTFAGEALGPFWRAKYINRLAFCVSAFYENGPAAKVEQLFSGLCHVPFVS
jgi:hypothetical protein